MKVCGNCGAENRDYATVCIECWAPLPKAEPVEPVLPSDEDDYYSDRQNAGYRPSSPDIGNYAPRQSDGYRPAPPDGDDYEPRQNDDRPAEADDDLYFPGRQNPGYSRPLPAGGDSVYPYQKARKSSSSLRPAPPPMPSLTERGDYSEVVSTLDWIFTLIVLCIPIVNIVMALVWSFGDNANPNKRTYCRALLVFVALGLLVAFIIDITRH